jgi:beta-mannanase
MRVPVIGSTLVATAGLVTYIVLGAPSAPLVASTPSPDAQGVSHGAVRDVAPTAPLRLPAATHRPRVGVAVLNTSDLDRFIAATGTTPDVVGVFEDWSLDRPLQSDIADTVAARGSRLLITWEPWDAKAETVPQPRFSLASIIDGSHDPYIDDFARSVQAHPHRVVIRFMHEMNGFWYPWASESGSATPREYVRAWRHVHHRFARLDVSNVRWMWAPNAVYPGAGDLRRLYPGDAYVDRVGISAYNWGARRHDGNLTQWQGFRSLFEPTIAEVRRFTDKPVWVAETGSTNSGGRKASWITNMFSQLRDMPEVAGVMWFDIRDAQHRADWRIETEPDAVQAWTSGFLARRSINSSESIPR